MTHGIHADDALHEAHRLCPVLRDHVCGQYDDTRGHNMRRYFNKVFDGLAKDGKGTMGRCHGFKLYLMCNDSGEIISFCLTGANVDAGSPKVWNVFAKVLFGKIFADKGYFR